MGCNGRAYADLSADADPNTGLEVVDDGNWGVVGGTSLATPLIAAYYAITGIDDTTSSTSAKWAYTTPDSTLLNDITSGSNGTCSANTPTSARPAPATTGQPAWARFPVPWSTGAPGIGGPPIKPQYTPATAGASNPDSYTESTRSDGATITGGIYPNGLDTTWWIQYWPANGGGSVQQTPASDIGSGTAPVMVTGYPTHLSPSTTYDYELVAQNSDGTTDGYTYSFTTGKPVHHRARRGLHVLARGCHAWLVGQFQRERLDRLGRVDRGLQLGLRRRHHRRQPWHPDRHPQLHQRGHLQRHADRHQQQRGERDDRPRPSRSTRLRPRPSMSRLSPRRGRRPPSTRAARPTRSARSPTTAGTSATATRDPTREHPDRDPYLRHARALSRSR